MSENDISFRNKNENKPSTRLQRIAHQTAVPFVRFGNILSKNKALSLFLGVILVTLVSLTVWNVFFRIDTTKVPATAVSEEYERRLPELKKAVEDSPNDTTARKNYAVALYATGNYKAARGQYQEALKRNDRDALAYNNLGNVQRDLGDYDAAIASYRKAIEITPSSVNSYVNLANVLLYSKNDAAGAVAVYQDGLKALPDNEQLQLLLGIAYEQAGRDGDARKTYEALLGQNPNNSAAKANLDRIKNS